MKRLSDPSVLQTNAWQPNARQPNDLQSSALNRRVLLAGCAGALASFRIAGGQEIAASGSTDSTADATDQRIAYDSPQTQSWRVGMILETPVTCTNVLATFPVPMDWPEQKITVTSKEVDRRVTKWDVRDVAKGAKQVVLQIPRVVAGSTVECTLKLSVVRSRIMAPTKTDDLVIPKRIGRDLRVFTGPSPYIDTTHPRIKAVSKELAADQPDQAWQRVEQIYDWVRDNVQYVEGSLKNASMALKDGKGDCEEMTSLIVALCRNARVPARMVWIPDHCYPEFYLEDGDGKGYWFPCQAAGTRQFGRMDEYRPVLQKGDRFKVPEKRTPVRYVAEFFKCDRKGSGKPRPKFIRSMIEA